MDDGMSSIQQLLCSYSIPTIMLTQMFQTGQNQFKSTEDLCKRIRICGTVSLSQIMYNP